MGDPVLESFYRSLRDEDEPDYRRLADITVDLGQFRVLIRPSRLEGARRYEAQLTASNPSGGRWAPKEMETILLGLDDVAPFIERLVLTVDLPDEWAALIRG